MLGFPRTRAFWYDQTFPFMSSDSGRLFPSDSIPAEFWNPAPLSEENMADRGVLTLPTMLAATYNAMVDRLGLRSLAAQRDSAKPPHGGMSLDATNEHFAQQFDGAAARAQLLLLDPLDKLGGTSDVVLRKLAGNRLLITDAPCGAGAATLALLSTTAQMRAMGILPREPLDVHLIAAELSEHARGYAEQIFQEIAAPLAEQAITVTLETVPWDVTKAMSNTDLVRRITVARERQGKHLLIVANFNGVLAKDRKQKEAKDQLGELFRYCTGKGNYALWIEPSTNNVVRPGGMFSWAWRKLIGWMFNKADQEPEQTMLFPPYNTHFHQALNPGQTARVSLALMAFNLVQPL